jgi:hypothetical protein
MHHVHVDNEGVARGVLVNQVLQARSAIVSRLRLRGWRVDTEEDPAFGI